MNHEYEPPHQETIPELVARLVIAFEKKQAAKKVATQSNHRVNNQVNSDIDI
jgi:outer membrane murein-binding lipoprotein Lpp